MKEVIQEVNINGDDIYLHMNAEIDGETIIDKKGDSFVGGFLSIMYSLMGGRAMPGLPGKNGVGGIDGGYQQDILTIDQPTNPLEFWTSNTLNTVVGGETWAQVSGIKGNDEMNGLRKLKYVSVDSGQTTEHGKYKFQLLGKYSHPIEDDIPDYIAITPNASENLNGKAFIRKLEEDITRRAETPFSWMDMRVGLSNEDVLITDFCLNDELPTGSDELNCANLGGQSTSSIGVDATTGELTITRTITNNSLGTLEIREVGLYCKANNGNGGGNLDHVFIARDLVNITLNVGKTVTINYIIKVSVDASGGILLPFLYFLKGSISSTSYGVADIDNSSQTIGTHDGDMMTVGPGGHSRIHIDLNGFEGQYVGPQIGIDGTAATILDYKLLDRITHDDLGMRYFGSYISDFYIDDDEAYFDCHRLFENIGGSVTVNEVALYVARASSGEFQKVHCFARHTPTPVVVDNGEFLKLSYRLKVSP